MANFHFIKKEKVHRLMQKYIKKSRGLDGIYLDLVLRISMVALHLTTLVYSYKMLQVILN